MKRSTSSFDFPVQTLAAIADRFGTPAYAYDLRRLRRQAEKLEAHLPPELSVLYSLKANASLALCDFVAFLGLGADVASAGELWTAREAGFPAEKVFVSGPYKCPETLSQLRTMPEAIVSIDSTGELEILAGEQLPNRAVLRLRPDFESLARVRADRNSRFGVPVEELPDCRKILRTGRIRLSGFHIFAGSQVIDAGGIIQHLHSALDLAERAAGVLGIRPELLNLGGGFGIPYHADEEEIDLELIGREFERAIERAAPARLMIELGRYLVAQCGWYLTTVVGHQSHRDQVAVVVDGGTHHRADLCGLELAKKGPAPSLLADRKSGVKPTDVLGCLSLPADILANSAPLPELALGDILAFSNAGAYGLWASPALFHGIPLPAEVAFEGEQIEVIRARPPAMDLLAQQRHLSKVKKSDSLSLPE